MQKLPCPPSSKTHMRRGRGEEHVSPPVVDAPLVSGCFHMFLGLSPTNEQSRRCQAGKCAREPAKGPNLNLRGGGSSLWFYTAALITWGGNVTEASEKTERGKMTNKKRSLKINCEWFKKKSGVACILFSGHSRWPIVHI